MVDLRQSYEYSLYLSKIGWIVERVAGINYFIKKIPLIGSILKVQRPGEIRIDKIRELNKKYRSFLTIIEPRNEMDAKYLASIGFKLSKNPYLPTKTLQIDLTQSKQKIYKSFKRNIRQGIKRGETIEVKEYSTPKQIEIFRESWKKCIKSKRFVPTTSDLINLRKSFPQSHSIFLASHNIVGSIIGGVIFTRVSHDITYYVYGFSSEEGRTSLTHAALLYQGILWAKNNGCKVFDFEGIYDERFPKKDWIGFTQFKKSFGGYEISYPGAYTKYRIPHNNYA